MQVFQNLRMDLARCGCTPIIGAVQGEANTRTLVVSLYDNGIAWDVPEAAVVDVAFKKPDGTQGIYSKLPDDSPATTFSGNVLTAILAPQMLTCPGKVTAAFVFHKTGEKTLATFPFTVTVTASPAAGAERSEDYYNPTISDIAAVVNEIYLDIEHFDVAVRNAEASAAAAKASAEAAQAEVAGARAAAETAVAEVAGAKASAETAVTEAAGAKAAAETAGANATAAEASAEAAGAEAAEAKTAAEAAGAEAAEAKTAAEAAQAAAASAEAKAEAARAAAREAAQEAVGDAVKDLTAEDVGAAPVKKAIVRSLYAAGWYRVGLISMGSCCVNIATEYGNTEDMTAVVYGSVTGNSASLSKAAGVFRSGNYKTIDQVRLVANGSACDVDIHYVPNSGNRVFISMDGPENWFTPYQEWSHLGEDGATARATLAL